MNKELLHWTWGKLDGGRKFLLLLGLASIVIAVTNVLFAFTMKLFIDNVTEGVKYSWITLFVMAVTVLTLEGLMTILSTYAVHKIQAITEKNVRYELFSKILSSDMQVIKDFNTGEFINMLTSDTKSISLYYPSMVRDLFGSIFAAIVASVALFYISWKMGIILFISIPLLILVINLISPLMQKANSDLQTNEDSIISFLQERLRKIEIIKSYFYQDQSNQKLYDLQTNKIKKYTRLGMIEGISIFSNSLMSAFIFLICLGVGSYFAMQGDFTVGSLLIIVQLLNYITWPINGISRTISSMNSSITSTKRIFKIMDIEQDYPSEYGKDINIASITIDNISFNYDENILIKDFTYTFEKNKVIGIVGKSGQGKTTLLKLILGLYHPSKGGIWAYTYDKEMIDLNSFRKYIRLVPSSDILFSGTVTENICMGCKRDNEKLIMGTQKANIYNYIESLPNGFDTVIGEDGNTFSSGQAQRIGIARALYDEHTQVILFDEPTSNLDKESINIFKDMLQELSKDKICIVVSHDNTIYDCFDETIRMCDDNQLNSYEVI